MSGPANAGLALLRQRVESIPAALRDFARLPTPEFAIDAEPRCVVTTGLGSSAAHARLLAHLLATELGVPARFAPTGLLARGAPPGSECDLLVVFSQGLSPNARFAFSDAARWGELIVVTGQSGDGDGDRAQWRRALDASGAGIFALPAGEEFGALVRVVGPMLGLAAAFNLARALAGAQLRAGANLVLDFEAIAERVAAAGARLDAQLAGQCVEDLLRGELALVASEGYGECLHNLSTKFLEGFGQPLPPVWDGVEFAHGGLQRLWSDRGTLVHLRRAGCAEDDVLGRALAASIDPARHRIVGLESVSSGACAVFEHEALVNEWMLRWLEATGGDPSEWPGRGRDGALYDRSPDVARLRAGADVSPRAALRAASAGADRDFARRTSPEIAEALASGRTTAVLALGSTEQHGAHLPLATDTWIGEWLAARVCARIEGSFRLPVVPFGCASEHMDFAGTLSLEAPTLRALLGDLLASLAQHGFREAFVFSAHGGNVAFLRDEAAGLAERAAPMTLRIFSDHVRLDRVLAEASRALGSSPEAAGHHAGELETSIIGGLRPRALRSDRVEAGVAPRRDGDEGQSLFYPSLRPNAPSGVVGDPRSWDATRAEPYLDAWVDELLRYYEAARAAAK